MASNTKKNLIKNNGQIFTPDYLVKNILDFAGYIEEHIIEKHIIDNSCGAGAFLTEIVCRYCEQSISKGYSLDVIKQHLETYIHGIELEDDAYQDVLLNLSSVANFYGIKDIKWDIHHADALTITEYNGRMDYVIGNPPYVRVHNLNESYKSVKSFSFASSGMTDLYLVFYELGLRMLNANGKLCYIAPSSWLSSLAGSSMRRYILSKKNLVALVDLEHFQPFKATAYTMIVLFQNNKKKSTFYYYRYDTEKLCPKFISELAFSEMEIQGNFYLAESEKLNTLRTIRTSKVPKRVSVKNGFATLADKVFIGNVPETEITIPIIKASTGKWYRGLFPYKTDGSPIPEQQVLKNKILKDYFEIHKKELTKGKHNMPGWIYYGRTQALKDVAYNKYAINSIIKDIRSLKLNLVPSGSGVYSGLYILTNVSEDVLKEIILSQDFIDYITALKSYKSGGYYTYNSKDLEQYINYKLSKMNYENTGDSLSAYECGLFKGCLEFF